MKKKVYAIILDDTLVFIFTDIQSMTDFKHAIERDTTSDLSIEVSTTNGLMLKKCPLVIPLTEYETIATDRKPIGSEL